MLKKRIYLDYAAGALPNPSSIHGQGVEAKTRLEKARRTVAGVIGSRPDEIIFTSGGTEGNNLSLLGLLEKGDHCVSTLFEHPSVLGPLAELEKRGVEVTYLRPTSGGLILAKEVKRALKPNTKLASIIYVQNEIGTVQDLKEIRKSIGKEVLLHTDACQAPGLLPIRPRELGVDLMTFNGHKICAPAGLPHRPAGLPASSAGIGFLFVRNGVSLKSLFFGGGQEKGLRSGTQNVEGVMALAEVLALAEKNRQKESARLTALRDYFRDRVLKEIPDAILNGHPVKRVANNINISFLGADSEYLVLALDKEGVAVSAGSACVSGQSDSSYVIMAIKNDPRYAQSAVRFSLGRETKKSDLDYVFKKLKKIVAKARWKI